MKHDLNAFITLNIDCAHSNLSFLLDTGAAISIVKENTLLSNVSINEFNKCHIQGIGNSLVETKGIIGTNIYLQNFKFFHTFHVVSNNFPINYDGILGLDFLKNLIALYILTMK